MREGRCPQEPGRSRRETQRRNLRKIREDPGRRWFTQNRSALASARPATQEEKRRKAISKDQIALRVVGVTEAAKPAEVRRGRIGRNLRRRWLGYAVPRRREAEDKHQEGQGESQQEDGPKNDEDLRLGVLSESWSSPGH